jgi:hypothetical protein
MNEEDERMYIMPLVLVILGVVSQKDRQGNVADFLHKVGLVDNSSITISKPG